MNIEEIYEYNNRVFVFLEYMEGGSMEKITKAFATECSEGFIKYTVYMAAKGLKEMHDRHILHRDFKSDNILCNEEG